jgi:hypothetical protein
MRRGSIPLTTRWAARCDNVFGPFPDWLISGGESGGGARQMDPQWVRDIIADCQNSGVAPFHKQWGTYKSNPLVTEQGMSVKDAKALDSHGKGGGLVDGELIREFPLRIG